MIFYYPKSFQPTRQIWAILLLLLNSESSCCLEFIKLDCLPRWFDQKFCDGGSSEWRDRSLISLFINWQSSTKNLVSIPNFMALAMMKYTCFLILPSLDSLFSSNTLRPSWVSSSVFPWAWSISSMSFFIKSRIWKFDSSIDSLRLDSKLVLTATLLEVNLSGFFVDLDRPIIPVWASKRQASLGQSSLISMDLQIMSYIIFTFWRLFKIATMNFLYLA